MDIESDIQNRDRLLDDLYSDPVMNLECLRALDSIELKMKNKRTMKINIGTKSVLFGAHCFLIHPFFLFLAWWKIYGFPWDPRLWVAFIVHDLGYWGKPNMDGEEGEQHPYWGAFLMGALFGKKWFDFTLYHSRFLAKKQGAQYSKLCVADKYAISITPWWINLPLMTATGEIKEYMKDAEKNSNGELKVESSKRKWYDGVQDYVRRWVAEHKDLKVDNWTTTNRQSVG